VILVATFNTGEFKGIPGVVMGLSGAPGDAQAGVRRALASALHEGTLKSWGLSLNATTA